MVNKTTMYKCDFTLKTLYYSSLNSGRASICLYSKCYLKNKVLPFLLHSDYEGSWHCRENTKHALAGCIIFFFDTSYLYSLMKQNI